MTYPQAVKTWHNRPWLSWSLVYTHGVAVIVIGVLCSQQTQRGVTFECGSRSSIYRWPASSLKLINTQSLGPTLETTGLPPLTLHTACSQGRSSTVGKSIHEMYPMFCCCVCMCLFWWFLMNAIICVWLFVTSILGFAISLSSPFPPKHLLNHSGFDCKESTMHMQGLFTCLWFSRQSPFATMYRLSGTS